LRSACGLPAASGLFQPVRDFVEGGLRRHAIEEARIDHHAVIDIGFLGNLEGRASPSSGITTGMTGRPYLRAKSRSRWSPDGQPKMAPVP
jgi:hypothetical protein